MTHWWALECLCGAAVLAWEVIAIATNVCGDWAPTWAHWITTLPLYVIPLCGLLAIDGWVYGEPVGTTSGNVIWVHFLGCVILTVVAQETGRRKS